MSKVSYASTVGILMYVMVCTRLDIAHAVGVMSRFLSNPIKEHREGVKWILGYLKGTAKMHLSFRRSNLTLQGFSDANLGGELDGRKSTKGHIFSLGGTTISWKSKLQGRVSLLTTKAEYVAISKSRKKMIWLKSLLKELGKKQDDSPLFKLQEFSKKTVVIVLEIDSKGDCLCAHCLTTFCILKPCCKNLDHYSAFASWDGRTLDVGIVGRTSIKTGGTFSGGFMYSKYEYGKLSLGFRPDIVMVTHSQASDNGLTLCGSLGWASCFITTSAQTVIARYSY
ncbi:hypothetical protein V8G54_030342 [Vigna mungo]|uniref:Retrovirus-related Pol polyprotein from transposon TNT 1-94 n=1 Tax=Vigna mungo TaxID=3915 RepID=A0AAQ3MW39_VIGMU